MKLKEIRPRRAGDKIAIVAVERDNGRCQVTEFMVQLHEELPKVHATLTTRLDMLREKGTLRNSSVIKPITDYASVQEIRHPKHSYRITCFYFGGQLILVEAWHKKASKNKKAQDAYKRAEQLFKMQKRRQ